MENSGDVDPKKIPNAPSQSVPFYRLFSFAVASDYVLMIVGGCAAAVHGAAMPVFFIFLAKLIHAMGTAYQNPAGVSSHVAKYALDYVYLGIVALISGWLEVSLWMLTGERQSNRMRSQYLKATLSQDVSFFDLETSTGEIVVGISSSTILVQEAISEKARNCIHYMGRFCAGFAVAFSSLWKLSLLTLCVLPLIAIAGGLLAYVMTKLASRSQKAYVRAGNISDEAISQIRAVHSFIGEQKAIKSYTRALYSTLKLGARGGLIKGLGIGTLNTIVLFTFALLVWYASHLVRNGVANGSVAFTTILNVVFSGLALGQAVPDFVAFGKAKAAAYTILEITNKNAKVDQRAKGKTLPKLEGHVELQNICFNYPSRPDFILFQNFSLKIPPGKVAAIVGSSGSGKSTVISLIERFYDPLSGQVLIDGEDIKNLQLKWLRDQIGLVNQEPILFATSIRENILYGKEDASMEEIVLAAKISGAEVFINQLPDRYETRVGERGVQLSGGQRQRIAIARAMIRNPAILLLDEATSALDAESEKSVQEALNRVMIGRTTVIVAHRLSTIRNADMIAVVERGSVVECGTHEELMQKGETGAYTNLVKLQESNLNQCRDIRQSRISHGSLSQRALSFCLSAVSERELSEPGSKHFGSEVLHSSYIRPKQSFTRLLKMNKPELPFSLLGLLGAILAGAESPIFSLAITQCLISFYNPDKAYIKREVDRIALLFCGLGVVVVFAYALEHYFFGIVGERLVMRVRKMMFTAILRNEIAWFDENSSNMIASRLCSDATMVKVAIADRMTTLSQNLALISTAFVIAFLLSWRLAFVIIATYPLLVGAQCCEYLFMKGFGGNLSKAYEQANMIAAEAVGNIRTVAAFCAEEKIVELFNKELEEPKKKSFLRGQMAGIGYGISQLFMFSAYGLGFWYATTLITKHGTGFGPVIKCFMVLIVTSYGIAETLILAPDIAKGSQALDAVFEVLDRRTAIEPDDPKAEVVSQVKGLVELRNVDFSYPTRPDIMIFKDFNLKLHPGHSLALVGASGSGKSSVISLISRFYDPVEGRILIDGKDIKKLNLKSLRRHIGLVQQEPALFATTIYENIVYGKEGAMEAEVVEAANVANAHPFISSLPNGYETEVGEMGVQLSGGQKQRIAVARAVLKNPAILLLDEATSALDAESEKIVQEALDRLMKLRTTVIVAHRLSTIQNADRIAVLQDGQIVEIGSHEELLHKAGAYSRLITLQQQ